MKWADPDYVRMCIHAMYMYILRGWVFTKGACNSCLGGLIRCVNLTTAHAPSSCEQFPFVFTVFVFLNSLRNSRWSCVQNDHPDNCFEELHVVHVSWSVSYILYIGKFPHYKRFAWKISWSKIFTLWAFQENLTHGENVEEPGRDRCLCGCHVYHETWEAATGAVTLWWQAYLPISAQAARLYCP